ncbi:MAG: nitroreductase family protein [Candidatus Peregrinibacteria bacterium]
MMLDVLLRRRACRSFKADPVPVELIEELVKAAQFAPTARNRRPLEFIVVTDPKMRQAIADALVPQEFVAQAPVLIMPVADTKVASKPREDLALASQNIFLQATHLKLGSVWKHVHDGEEQEKIRSLLGIPPHYLIINVIPIGYPAEMPPPYTDAEFDSKKIHREKF